MTCSLCGREEQVVMGTVAMPCPYPKCWGGPSDWYEATKEVQGNARVGDRTVPVVRIESGMFKRVCRRDEKMGRNWDVWAWVEEPKP